MLSLALSPFLCNLLSPKVTTNSHKPACKETAHTYIHRRRYMWAMHSDISSNGGKQWANARNAFPTISQSFLKPLREGYYGDTMNSQDFWGWGYICLPALESPYWKRNLIFSLFKVSIDEQSEMILLSNKTKTERWEGGGKTEEERENLKIQMWVLYLLYGCILPGPLIGLVLKTSDRWPAVPESLDQWQLAPRTLGLWVAQMWAAWLKWFPW